MASKVTDFKHAQSKAKDRTRLAKQHWQLERHDGAIIEGPIAYFLDLESGYQKMLQLTNQVTIPTPIKPKHFCGLVTAVSDFTNHVVRQTPLPPGIYSDQPERQLLEYVAQYLGHTKAFESFVDKKIPRFSLYVAHFFDVAHQEYLLRPFATSHTELQTPEEIQHLFMKALSMDYQAHPEWFSHKAPVIPFGKNI